MPGASWLLLVLECLTPEMSVGKDPFTPRAIYAAFFVLIS